MNIFNVILVFTLVLGASPAASAQSTQDGRSFDTAAADIQQKLDQSLAELASLREQIKNDTLPLNRELSTLEAELSSVRAEYQKTTRLLDSRTLDLSNLRQDIKTRREETTYLSNLLGEYIRNLESRLHIAELQRYEGILEEARLALDNSTLMPEDVYEAQTAVLFASLDRLDDAIEGSWFDGTAVDASGTVDRGTFFLIGPAAFFRSADGSDVGTAEQRLGSLEPSIVAFKRPEDAQAATQVITGRSGRFPLDPTLGNAHKIERTEETLLEHVKKGGPVMIPIFILAGLALLVAIIKWIHLTLVRKPARKRIKSLLKAVSLKDVVAAKNAAEAIRGPAGRMLATGVAHLGEPRDLIEEVMYETVLETRLRLNRFLPFIAICAAAAPLLGLLGTVTGIINTFKLITVFGSGDVKTLSGGISEALVTTEFGLIVAIPALLLHAFLSRKAKGIVDQMEGFAIAFVNEVSRTYRGAGLSVRGTEELHDPDASTAATPTTEEQVRKALSDILTPVVTATQQSGNQRKHEPDRELVGADA